MNEKNRRPSFAGRGEARRLLGRAAWYFALTAVILVAAGIAVRHQMDRQHGSAGRLPAKMNYYAGARQNYDLVFVGDSRTLCAFHPEILDPALGIHSYNLGHWTNWFPTQYAEVDDLIRELPPDTVVVWSIGHDNFEDAPIEPAYPIGWRRLPDFLNRGFAFEELAADLAEFTPGPNLYTLRPRLMQSVDALMDHPVHRGADQGSDMAVPPLLAKLRDDPSIDHFDYYFDAAKIVSVGANLKNGSYLRYVFDPAFYRAKQMDLAAKSRATIEGKHFQADPRYWGLFVSILDSLARQHIRVVVNVLERAPAMYGSGDWRDETRAFMNGAVRHEVESRGMPFVSVDFDRLNDDDYFDQNHLNSTGVSRYSALLVPLLRDALAKWR